MKGWLVVHFGGYRRGRKIFARALAGSTALVLASTQPSMAQEGAQPQQAGRTRQFDIPSQPLTSAVTTFGDQGGLQITVDGAILSGLTSPPVVGSFSPADALSRLLTGTGITFRWVDSRSIALERVPQVAQPTGDGSIRLGPLQVEGRTAAASGETGVERDARKKDAVYDQDVSSSYAGKEEVERYKGVNTADVLKGMVNVFSGDARNGGALDPSIRGIQGPGRVPVIIDGTEQALTVWRGYNGASNRSYVDPSLIAGVQVLKGPVSTRGVNGATGGAVVINTLDAADILKPGQTFGVEFRVEGGNNSTDPRLPTLLTGRDYRTIPGFLGTGSGWRSPTYPYSDPSLRVNLRKSGDNEFLSLGDRAIRLAVAGRIGDFDLFGAYAFRERGNYFSGKHEVDYYQQRQLRLGADTFVRVLGLHYEPGNEIPNTSSQLESLLLKATWRIADDQALQIGFRDSRSKFGEILPSRIMTAGGGYFGNVQWPLSKVHAQAWNAEYKWQPDNKWIDLKTNLWLTDTVSDTYSSGGFPNAASLQDPIIINSALSNARNDRYGITASNQMKLTSRLDLRLEGTWQHEKLRSDDPFTQAIANGWRQFPRAGRREDYRIGLHGEWRPASFLKLNAGLTYSGYWAVDDFLRNQIAAGNARRFMQVLDTSRQITYRTQITSARDYEAWLRARNFDEAGIRRELASFAARGNRLEVENRAPDWVPDAEGRYRRADNACLNGSVSSLPNWTGYCGVSWTNTVQVVPNEATRKTGHGWAPTLSATAYISGSSRAYVRYAEAYRFPSMFESTIGFSSSVNLRSDLKPEHLYAWEAAWIQDLRPLFGLNGEGQHADLKLTWYHNTTRNVIERNTNLMFTNIDRQEIAGFELQARYDNGRFFTDLSAGHMTKNKVCDESVAALSDWDRGRVPDCVKYGFISSFLLTQATPEDSINWALGGRFFDRRLEVGGRLIWYSRYKNPQLDRFIGGPIDDRISGYGLNIPYTWGEIVTFDAYAKFRLNDRFSAELVGTNLNDRYYLDPLSRSLLPAPGRTVRLSLTGRF